MNENISGLQPYPEEHDACAIIATMRASGESTHGNLKRTIEALAKMGHRSGDVHSEGDGCGLLTDIPRRLWTMALEEAGRPTWLAEDKRFFVGHLMIPLSQRQHIHTWQAKILRLFSDADASLLLTRPGATRREALGRLARAQEPYFWQVAGVMNRGALEGIESKLFEIALEIEKQTPVHVASLSSHSVVYKVRGSVETLYHYYPELRSREYTTGITIGHARYSTNTATAFERVQPFSLLGHNGEINTISRLREEAQMLGAQLVTGGSDSQDLNRVLETLIHRYGFSLVEAMEIVFPPILSEVEVLAPDLQSLYRYYRTAFGPFAQGPAAIVARYGDTCVFSVDALGLRPLWFGNTDKEFFFSSEKGVVPLDLLNSDPKPLAPGEKMAAHLLRDKGVKILNYTDIQQRLPDSATQRFGSLEALTYSHNIATHSTATDTSHSTDDFKAPTPNNLVAFGWSRDDQRWAQALAEQGKDPIASTGYDGPLAALVEIPTGGARPRVPLQNLSDYFKEQVAVVTNPAVDREREQEHFSTQVLIGPRAPLLLDDPLASVDGEIRSQLKKSHTLTLDMPIVCGGHGSAAPLPLESYRQVAQNLGTMLLEDVVNAFPEDKVEHLALATKPKEPTRLAARRLAEEAVAAALEGAELLVLDDAMAFEDDHGWLDPHLAVATVDRALRAATANPAHAQSCRRNVGIIVRSGALRNLHDIILALGLGADALAPYRLLEVAIGDSSEIPEESQRERMGKILRALHIGVEKVISTMGIHELRGYGRTFASIGLSTSLTEVVGTRNYAGSTERGLAWEDMDRSAKARLQTFQATKVSLPRVPRLYPKLIKALHRVAQGQTESELRYTEAFVKIREQEKRNPVALRHIMGFVSSTTEKAQPVQAEEVDTEITGHDLPFVIASMSFGSQSEIAFKAYAEAAQRLNIIALNGEGGEIETMMGKYPHNRGQQIASGRFGVNINLLNASNLIEIKIGQGAKPGEGGHLPGAKVSKQVARARHVSPGIDLISPSNNHDIYSIEDLAQFIEELKTANPKARVAVKVPVVPGIGVIAVGIAKAGADIITLSGYEGGTGAARAHSIRHVGLPTEIGLSEAHQALVTSNMRRRVELWADGGVRSPDDVVKLMCLGANRVGFGTMAMIALGCVLCRRCQTGTCHMGITTQIASVAEAEARGVKNFSPQDLDRGAQHLVNLFQAFGEEIRAIVARLGVARLQDLVGHVEYLEQTLHFEAIDLRDILAPISSTPRSHQKAAGVIPLRRPRNHLTTVVSNLVMEAIAAGEPIVAFEDDRVTPVDRALGTHLAGALTRYQHDWMWQPGHNGVGGQSESWRPPVNGHNGFGHRNGSGHRNSFGNSNGNGHENGNVKAAYLRFYASSVPGNGLGAFSNAPITITVEGGAQDGVGKGLYGGRILVLKGYNHDGIRIDGAVGKGLAYGAIAGTIIVQGNADSRACVRLSGADVIIGGELTQPIDDHLGLIGARANVKGFLCEYMTAGRVLILGDPGPWMCAGMTGGTLYLRLQPEMGLDEAALRRRIAHGANVVLLPVGEVDRGNLHSLINTYADELSHNHQQQEAERTRALLHNWDQHFVKIVAERDADIQSDDDGKAEGTEHAPTESDTPVEAVSHVAST